MKKINWEDQTGTKVREFSYPYLSIHYSNYCCAIESLGGRRQAHPRKLWYRWYSSLTPNLSSWRTQSFGPPLRSSRNRGAHPFEDARLSALYCDRRTIPSPSREVRRRSDSHSSITHSFISEFSTSCYQSTSGTQK